MAYRAITVSGGTFQFLLLASRISYLMQEDGSSCRLMCQLNEFRLHKRLFVVSQPLLDIRLPTYPSKLTDGNLKSLGSTGFARHYYRHRCLLSLPRGTKMFQFPRLPLPGLYIQPRVIGHDSNRVSPFGNLRFKACLAAPRSLSQLTTSFIGILCQGIPLCALE